MRFRPARTLIPATLLEDGALLAGAGLVAYGASRLNLPAGIIVGGLLLLALGLLHALNSQAGP